MLVPELGYDDLVIDDGQDASAEIARLLLEGDSMSAEEQAQLPTHMRREEVCERTGIPYRLRVLLDGAELEETLIRGAGTREDRPIYVYRELRVSPGTHRLEIDLTPRAGAEAPAGEAPVEALELAEELDLADGDVALITRSEDGRLVVRRSEP